jgi:hypothetical protein
VDPFPDPLLLRKFGIELGTSGFVATFLKSGYYTVPKNI